MLLRKEPRGLTKGKTVQIRGTEKIGKKKRGKNKSSGGLAVGFLCPVS